MQNMVLNDKRIQHLLIDIGMTKRQMLIKAGMSRDTYVRLCRHGNGNIDSYARVADALGVRIMDVSAVVEVDL